MRSERQPSGLALHATAVSLGGWALLLLGPSRSGKSSLAAGLIARSSARLPILLIGDDRILVETAGSGMMVRSHPRIAGFIERRGLGIVASPFVERAVAAALVCLGPATMPHPALANLPMLRPVSKVTGDSNVMGDAVCDEVLAWFHHRLDAATWPQVAAKDDSDATLRSKD